MGKDINRVTLQGRLTRDPELTYVGAKQTPKVALSVVTNRSFKKEDEWKEEPTFHNVELWDSAATHIDENFVKGEIINIEGTIKNDSWEDKDGVKKYKTYVRASSFSKVVNTYKKKDSTPAAEETPSGEPVAASVDADNDIPF